MNLLSPSAQKVQDTLLSLGINSTVIEYTESTRTAQEAADRVGCKLGQIVKSMIFRGLSSNQGVLVLTSGSNRVDEKKIENYIGETTGRADPEFVRRVTGFAIGGVPPIGHNLPLATFIDEDLLQFEKVWAAAGTPNAVFELSSTDMIKITGGKIVAVKPG
jgi:prolyl-tRNA editing enzyme YbaK/EbsC (Cys-tRNA(Pro) deacylase)